MSKWWFKAPIILTCILMVATFIVFGTVARASSGMPEFGLLISGMLEGFEILIKGFLDMLILVW